MGWDSAESRIPASRNCSKKCMCEPLGIPVPRLSGYDVLESFACAGEVYSVLRGHKAGSADPCGLEGQKRPRQQVQAGRKGLLLPLPLSGHPRSGNKHFRIG